MTGEKALGVCHSSVRVAFREFERLGLVRGQSQRTAAAAIERAWPEPYEGPGWIAVEPSTLVRVGKGDVELEPLGLRGERRKRRSA